MDMKTQRSTRTHTQTSLAESLAPLPGCVVILVPYVSSYQISVPRFRDVTLGEECTSVFFCVCTQMCAKKRPSSDYFGQLPNLLWFFVTGWVSLWVPSDVMGSGSSVDLAACRANH